jgi:hypothetical protein
MTDRLDDAIAELLEDLQDKLNEISETKKAINLLLRRSGKEVIFPDESPERIASPKIRADQFYGRPLATSVQDFLEQRKKATGDQACDATDILKGLEAGGFDFKALGWKDTDRLRSLSISLAKNTKLFHRLPNGLFGLLAWYPEKASGKRGRSDSRSEASDEKDGGDGNAS